MLSLKETARILARLIPLALLIATDSARALGDNSCEDNLELQKYSLTKECSFKESVTLKINPFWEAGVHKGVVTRDGIDLHYAVATAASARHAIVIASGRTEGMVKYKELIYDLVANGYSVYIIDHRGQGFSTRTLKDPHKGHVEDFQAYVDDLDFFLREKVLPEQHERLFLLGHSMGGGIATLHLEQHQSVFDAAALTSPMHEPSARILGSAKLGCLWFKSSYRLCSDCYVGFLDRGYSAVKFEKNILTSSPARYNFMLSSYETEEAAGRQVVLGGPTRRWLREACMASERMIENAGEIDTPTLVLQAGDDAAVTAAGQDAFCNELQASSDRGCFGGGPIKKGLEKAKHELLIEADSYRNYALTVILDFFAQHSGV